MGASLVVDEGEEVREGGGAPREGLTPLVVAGEPQECGEGGNVVPGEEEGERSRRTSGTCGMVTAVIVCCGPVTM